MNAPHYSETCGCRNCRAVRAQAPAIDCQRCANSERWSGTPATHRIEWRETYDEAHWKNRVTLRCDRCTAALYAHLNVAHPDNYGGAQHGEPRGSIEKDEVIAAS